MSTPHPEALRVIANRLFDDPSQFVLGTDSAPFSGVECAVYVLEVQNRSTRVCFRIFHGPYTPLIRHRITEEIKHRRLVDDARIDCFQPLIAADPSADNPLGTGYLVLDWAEGKTMEWSDTIPSDPAIRQRIMRTVANASLDLLRTARAGMRRDYCYCTHPRFY
jgi:hypothetical protein